MYLIRYLRENISKQEKYSILLTIIGSVIYFTLYSVLGGSHILSMIVLVLLGIIVVASLIINTLEEFKKYSNEESEEPTPVTKRED